MSNILFSHRPQLGVSVGVTAHNGQLFLAASFTNDGTSRNGVLHEERIDRFSRERARQIVSGRLAGMISGSKQSFAIALSTNLTPKEFIYLFRELFKPDPYETDTTFQNTLTLEPIGSWHARMSVNDIWNRIVLMANGIANHSLRESLPQQVSENPAILEELRAAIVACGS